MDDCPFCRIVAGDKEAYVVYEDDTVIAFLDIRPATEGHTLVVPRDHRTEFLEDPGVASALSRATSHIATAMKETLDPAGFSTFHTSGSLVGTVDHAHVHLVPRYGADDLTLALPRGHLDTEAAQQVVEAVSAAVPDRQ